MSLRTALLGLRNDKRILRLPPYLSLICVVIGVAWLFVLPLNDYSRKTYISENALLPGQVHAYFGGSEHNIFRAYRHEVAALTDRPRERRVEVLSDILRGHGLKVATQTYSYEAAGNTISGENVYAVLQGPRADATEAIVLIGAWRNFDGVLNQSGVALVLTLARYFKRWSLWSKDVIFLISEDSVAGPKAWVDAYHSTHDPNYVAPLPLKSGALQGAIAVDYPAGPGGHRFDKIHIIYDGVNGQLPNLDLANTVITIATSYMGIGTTIQRMWNHDNSYIERLETMLRGMLVQGIGRASGPHSSFMPYHIDAVTLQTVGDGWQDEMSLGRVLESTIRSLNNLLEHLHQSFFFYLLMSAERFVSIGTYLPSAMLVAVNFSIMAIALWIRSGRPAAMPSTSSITTVLPDTLENESLLPNKVEVIEHGGAIAIVPKVMLATEERKLLFPAVFVCGCHLLGSLPLALLNTAHSNYLPIVLHITTSFSTILPIFAAVLYLRLSPDSNIRQQALALIPMFSLLLLGAALSTLSTLNFSLGLFTGLLATPLTLAHTLALTPSENANAPDASRASPSSAATGSTTPAAKRTPQRPAALAYLLILLLISPTSTIYLAATIIPIFAHFPTLNAILALQVPGISITSLSTAPWTALPPELLSGATLQAFLVQASEAWHVTGTWTAVVLWVVWWPAWVAAVFCTAVRAFE